MDVFHDLGMIPERARGSVLVIGNFDGVHRGHAALLARGREIADKTGAKLGVLTFEPHPRALFQPDEPPSRITPAPLKHDRLRAGGVETLFSLNFDWDFASQSAEDFIRNVLASGTCAAHVVVGHDFRFGQLRKGMPEDISRAGIPVTIVEEVQGEGGLVLSSSHVRACLRCGDMAGANAVLGWDWEIRGMVIKGDSRGRALGFPTANMDLGDTIHPAYGVYAALVQVEGADVWHKAAVNIGIRPMFETLKAQVETHILDFAQDIYGRILRVRPVKFLRGEAKFHTLEELVTQIARDCAEARGVLGG